MPTVSPPRPPAAYRRFNVFDSATLGEIAGRSVMLFDRANIGLMHRCNLMLPGMRSMVEVAVVEHMYARTDLDPALEPDEVRQALHRLAAHTQASLIMGDMPRQDFQHSLAELLADRAWEPPSVTAARLDGEERAAFLARVTQRREEGAMPLRVPVRQYVRVSLFGDPVSDPAAIYRAAAAPFPPVLRDARVWVHLEGYLVRDSG